MRNLYRAPDKAYSSLDFTGIGSFSEEDFLKSYVVKNLPYTEVEMRDFLFLSNMFKGEMNFDSFKKTFFPHLYLIKEGEESEDEKKEQIVKR
jgi:hypothetical protein